MIAPIGLNWIQVTNADLYGKCDEGGETDEKWADNNSDNKNM